MLRQQVLPGAALVVDPEIGGIFAADAANATCADCRRASSTEANVTIGAFVCATCGFYHKHTLHHVMKELVGSRWSNQGKVVGCGILGACF